MLWKTAQDACLLLKANDKNIKVSFYIKLFLGCGIF